MSAVPAEERKQVVPCEELQRLLPALSSRELYDVALSLLEEASERAANYAALLLETDDPTEAIEEGLAMATRFDSLFGHVGFDETRRGRASRRLWKAARKLEQAWQEPPVPRRVAVPKPESLPETAKLLDIGMKTPDGRRYVRLYFTDDDVLAALADAEQQRAALAAEKGYSPQEGAWASCVADVLAGNRVSGEARTVALFSGDVSNVGKRLAALAREQRARLVSKPYEPRRYVLGRHYSRPRLESHLQSDE